MKCVQVYLPALVHTEKLEKLTETCRKGIVSFEGCVKLEVDTKKYKGRIAEAWNYFFDKWRGKDYDYLLITASDVQFDPMCIDFLIKYMDENDAGIVTPGIERDLETFKKNFGQILYSDEIQSNIETPTFMIRKGVIEKVGRVDQWFPIEFVERDYFYRCKLQGVEIRCLANKLTYTKDSQTVGVDEDRLKEALNRYINKWGGDANREMYQYPFNDINLNYDYTVK